MSIFVVTLTHKTKTGSGRFVIPELFSSCPITSNFSLTASTLLYYPSTSLAKFMYTHDSNGATIFPFRRLLSSAMAYRLINIDSLISDNIRIYMRLCISPVFSREERRNRRHRQDLRSHIYEVWRMVEQERPKRRANGTAG